MKCNSYLVEICFSLASLFMMSLAKTYYCSGKLKGTFYCCYEPGKKNSRIIVNAPHGGDLQPKNIPDRDVGCYSKQNKTCIWNHNCGEKNKDKCSAIPRQDYYATEIATMLVDKIKNLTGQKPYFIINNVHRVKFDANREIHEATFDVPEAEKVFEQYHGYIKKAMKSVRSPGLFIDVHCHCHDQKWIEVGYLIGKVDLKLKTFVPKQTSIRALLKHSKYSLERILRGDKSLGYYLQEEGYNTIPSPKNRFAEVETESYFKGGYNMREYGSKDKGDIDAIQFEIPEILCTKEKGPGVASAIARSIVKWMRDHYD